MANQEKIAKIKEALEVHNKIQKQAFDTQDALCETLSSALNTIDDYQCFLVDIKNIIISSVSDNTEKISEIKNLIERWGF